MPDTPPLRETKKKRTQQRILANAIALFQEHGIRRTRLSEVARASEVSEATLFNYFANKGQLAEGWVRGEVVGSLVAAATESRDRGGSLRAAIRGACRSVAAASALEPALRHEAWREAGRAVGLPEVDLRPLAEGLREEQKRERVRADLRCEDLADMLIEAIEGGLIAGLRGAGEASGAELEAALSQRIRERVDLVLDGARKRNERVHVPSANRPTESLGSRPRPPAPST